MKVGIITFHFARNYGAMLQAYGLQEYLKSVGHEVYMVDYRPAYKSMVYKKNNYRDWVSRNPLQCVKRLYRYLKYKKIRNARWDGFTNFALRNFHLYPYTDGEDFHCFDAIFIGSDQVWSPAHTGNRFDDLMFGVGIKCRTISYAPSCSFSHLSDEQKEYFQSHLDAMTAISVREDILKKMLQPLTRHDISTVVDPTLLAGKSVFESIALPIKAAKPYIVVYEIRQHDDVYLMAKDIAKQLDADVVELTNGLGTFHRKSMDEACTPEKFLGYIKNAACVITTSFHGTAFSILFERPFYTVLQDSSADNRMIHLLYSVGLQSRAVPMGKHVNFDAPDFKEAKLRIETAIKESENFISNSLNL